MTSKPPCKYGAACYRKSSQHLASFSHPSEEKVSENNDPPPQKKQKLNTEIEKKESSPQQLPSPVEENASNGSVQSTRKKTKEKAVGDECDIRSKFLIDLPEDFYLFWDFCKSLDHDNPPAALRSALSLDLTGPYDVLSGSLRGVSSDRCVLHGRHYYDPPEMTTVLTEHNADSSSKAGFHIGYFRDDPKSGQYLVVSNDSSQDYELVIEASNIFSAVRQQIQSKLEGQDKAGRSTLEKLDSKLDSFLSSHKTIPCVDVKDLRKKRTKTMIGQTLNKMGIIVPYDKKTELGYRPVPFTKRELKRTLQSISAHSGDTSAQDKLFEPIQEVVTYVQFANDECDYGMGLELGMDLFSHGDPFLHSVIGHLLPVAYDLLQREEYGKICSLHLAQRGKDPLDATEPE